MAKSEFIYDHLAAHFEDLRDQRIPVGERLWTVLRNGPKQSWVSHQSLADLLGVSLNTLQYAVKSLMAQGRIRQAVDPVTGERLMHKGQKYILEIVPCEVDPKPVMEMLGKIYPRTTYAARDEKKVLRAQAKAVKRTTLPVIWLPDKTWQAIREAAQHPDTQFLVNPALADFNSWWGSTFPKKCQENRSLDPRESIRHLQGLFIVKELLTRPGYLKGVRTTVLKKLASDLRFYDDPLPLDPMVAFAEGVTAATPTLEKWAADSKGTAPTSPAPEVKAPAPVPVAPPVVAPPAPTPDLDLFSASW